MRNIFIGNYSLPRTHSPHFPTIFEFHLYQRFEICRANERTCSSFRKPALDQSGKELPVASLLLATCFMRNIFIGNYSLPRTHSPHFPTIFEFHLYQRFEICRANERTCSSFRKPALDQSEKVKGSHSGFTVPLWTKARSDGL